MAVVVGAMEVTVNAAMSADGKLSTAHRVQVVISGPADFSRVEGVRQEHDAILVGVGTVLADDPSLTLDTNPADGPTRIILDSHARTPPTARVFDSDPETVVFVTEVAPEERIRAIEQAGATVIDCEGEQVPVLAVLSTLSEMGLASLMVEGGGEVLYSFFAANAVDRCLIYVGDMIIGGRESPTLVDGPGFTDPAAFPRLTLHEVTRMDDGVLLDWRVQPPD